MIIKIALMAFIPMIVSAVIGILNGKRAEARYNTIVTKTNAHTSENFTVAFPYSLLKLGIVCDAILIAFALAFTFSPDGPPEPLFYVIWGGFCMIGVYLIILTLCSKVIVREKTIIALSFLRKPYVFTFDEISSVKRQVKQNKVESERMVIRTTSGRKVIVERGQDFYRTFMDKIKSEVEKSKLVGF